ncbi:LexA family transcriptional regulator [Neisseria wadsworthii]|uniref:LexA family transcriptional regulator n=1 Tax=Neisseria wadsworthii TaxID=607711 RepID=UPI0015F4E504|nr:S24 family peptidase [Neisseria wadsworthii]QMT34807.1 helix-turn-helix domain-containing protein [Neisseria wadsworthii]
MDTKTPVNRAKIALSVKTDIDMARKLGVSPSVVGGYNRRQTVPLEQCIKIAELTGVSLDWLILGKGEKNNDNIAAHSNSDFTTVPLYDTPASAGNGSFFDTENIIQHIPFDIGWLKREGLQVKHLVCLPIKGDSMQPGLIDGDIVLVNRAAQQGDGVFVLRIGDALRIKRLQWLANGSLRISSDNPLYQPEILNLSQLDDSQFAIIGACHTKIGRVS